MTEVHQIQFNNYLVDFIKKLQKILPNEKKLLTKYYKYYRKFVDDGKRVDFIAEFVQYIAKYDKEVLTCDEGLFSEEELYYPQKAIQLMKGIDFKRIWRYESLSENSKANIWKYLQTLYIIGTFVLKEAKKYDELLKQQQEIINNLIQNMKYEHKIKQTAAQLEEQAAGNSGSGSESSLDFKNLSDLFDENNIITQIAIEVAKEINLSDIGQDPMQIISLLVGQNSHKLNEIIQKVQEKLIKTLKDKNLSETELMTQAKQMHDKIFSKLKGIPGMADIEKLSQQIAHNMSNGQDTQQQQQLQQCQEVIQQLTNNLKQNLEAIDQANVDHLHQNLETIISKLQDQTDTNKSVESSAPETSLSENEDEDQLKQELLDLKAKCSKRR